MTEQQGKDLPQYEEGARGNFRPPYGLDFTDQQKIILNVLWRASTSTAKIKAMNALCYHLKANNQKQDFEYYVIFEGTKRGVYHTWGTLQKAVGKRNQPQGWKAFYTQAAAEKALIKNL